MTGAHFHSDLQCGDCGRRQLGEESDDGWHRYPDGDWACPECLAPSEVEGLKVQIDRQAKAIRELRPAFDDLDWIENQLHSGVDVTLGVGLDEDDGKVHVRLVGFDGVHLFKGDDLHLAVEAARLAVVAGVGDTPPQNEPQT